MKKYFSLLLVPLLALAGCALPSAVPGNKINFKTGAADLKQDTQGGSIEAKYCNSNGVITSSLKTGQFAAQNNPAVLNAAAAGQAVLNQSVASMVDSIANTAANLAVQGFATYMTGGASLAGQAVKLGTSSTLPGGGIQIPVYSVGSNGVSVCIGTNCFLPLPAK